jgi:hypothetical protein
MLLVLTFFVIHPAVVGASDFAQMMEDLKSKMQQQQGLKEEVSTSSQPTISKMSEKELAKIIDEFPSAQGTAEFAQKKDGFEVNGRRYIDAEGKIVKYGYDSVTADVTYLAEIGKGRFIIKHARALTDAEPVTIATAERRSDGWHVTTITGKTIRGETMIPLSKGFVISRETALFVYVPGKGTQQVALPDNYVISSFQNGQIQQSRYILIEKAPETNTGLFSKFGELGSALGVSKKEDYAFFNVDKGDMIPIDVTLDSKTVALHSNCQKKNSFVNECARVDFVESLYDKNGLPNGGHYYWRTSWINTKTGPFMIWTSSGFGSKTLIYNPKTNKKVIAFSRALGINYFTVKDLGNGKFSITAQLGLSSETINDIETFFNNAPAVTEG